MLVLVEKEKKQLAGPTGPKSGLVKLEGVPGIPFVCHLGFVSLGPHWANVHYQLVREKILTPLLLTEEDLACEYFSGL